MSEPPPFTATQPWNIYRMMYFIEFSPILVSIIERSRPTGKKNGIVGETDLHEDISAHKNIHANWLILVCRFFPIILLIWWGACCMTVCIIIFPAARWSTVWRNLWWQCLTFCYLIWCGCVQKRWRAGWPHNLIGIHGFCGYLFFVCVCVTVDKREAEVLNMTEIGHIIQFQLINWQWLTDIYGSI